MSPAAPLQLTAISHTGLWSGAERVLYRTVVAARDAGWRVEVLCPDGPFADRLDAAAIEVRPVAELKLPAGPRPVALARAAGRWVRTAPRVRRAAAASDLVLVNGLLGLPAVRLARIRTPVAWLVHDSIHRPDWALLLRVVAAAVDRGIAVSEAVAGPLRHAGIDVAVVHNGTDWPVQPAGDPDMPPVIGCAALLTEWKGQSVLLDAVARMRHREVVVELLGGRFPKSPDGAYVAALEARAAAPDLAGRVHMPGFVDDAADRMRRWTISVSPSIEPEACPLGVLESMSYGLAVVGTDHGGTPEVLGPTGRLVPAGDAEALARALDELLDDPEERQLLGRAARERVGTSFRLDEQTARLLEVLADVADGAR